jgi:hypothetical protein
MTDQEHFALRLRSHRQRSHMPLADIAAATRIKEVLLDGLEQNDLSGWPRGIYARAYVRAYATAIGLEGDETVDEFCRLFPHGDRRAAETIREIAGIIGAQSDWSDDFAHQEGDRRRGDTPRPAPRTGVEAFRWRVTDLLRALGTRVSLSVRMSREAEAGLKAPDPR